MGRTPGRAQHGHVGSDEEGWSARPTPQVERLRQRFTRFRRTHRPRTRYPQSLRKEVLAALQSGVAEPELRRACGLSAAQIAAWRRDGQAEAQQRPLVMQPARVFSVVDDEIQPDVRAERVIRPTGQQVELRIGDWSVCIRRIEE